jgi:tetratricopeptide (TPR) repeat protein
MFYDEMNIVVLNICSIYFNEKNYDKCISNCDQYIKRNNKNEKAYYLRGCSYMFTKNNIDAEKDYNYIIDNLNKDNIKVKNYLEKIEKEYFKEVIYFFNNLFNILI